MRIKRLLIASAVAIAIPALAQQVAQTQSAPAAAPPTATAPQPQPSISATTDDLSSGGADETAVEEVSQPAAVVPVKPPV